jgi:tetratricopeptide (TPR) repeat protein
VFFLPDQRIRLYREFKAIHPNDFQRIVPYYERHETAIRAFEFDAWFDCTLIYCQALYDGGFYRKHLVMCDYLLEIIIDQNIITWGGEDWYHKIIFQKALSLYQLDEFVKAQHVLRELLKMHPENEQMVRQLLLRCYLSQKPRWLLIARALAVLVVLLSVILVVIELSILSFFPKLIAPVQTFRYIILIGMLAWILVAETIHFFQGKRKVN